jgi:tRNA threonylcarbamoyl adenosine modification protein (Sua5/YciO/YrdC/YwlC family)
MRIIQINPINPQQRLIDQVVGALKQGAIIAYPTDTMYGIGCDIFNQKAVKRIYQIKNRDKSKPFSFICASLKDVSHYCFLSNSAYRLMKKCLPGPYTFILPAMKIVPKIMMTKQKTVGIRVPNNIICQQIVNTLGNPILTTSATLEEDSYLAEAFEVEEKIGNRIDLIIDGEPISPAPSSVISLIGDEASVVRVGKGDVSDFIT